MSLVRPAPAIRVFDDASAFRLLEEGWKSLFDRRGGWNVFLSWQWFRRWWESFGAGNQLRLLTLSHAGELVAVAPLMVETTRTGRSRLALIGCDRTTDYGDVLADPEFLEPLCMALADLVQEGFGQWERAELRSLAANSPLLGTFRQEAQRRGITTELSAINSCPAVRLAPSWDEYLATLSKKDRHELRRKVRRAESCGEQTVHCLTEVEEVGSCLESFFRLHRASAPEKAEFLDERMASFFRSVALTFAQEGWLRLNLLKIDGKDVAASISFSRGDRVLLYNSGLDPEYRVHSVGIALHAAEIEQAIREGKVCYDFLRGTEPYKYRFGAQDNPIYALTLLPEGAVVGEDQDCRGQP